MDSRGRPTKIPVNTLVCLEYLYNPVQKNILSYISERNRFYQLKFQQKPLSSLPQTKVEENKKFKDKRNYTEDEWSELMTSNEFINQKRRPSPFDKDELIQNTINIPADHTNSSETHINNRLLPRTNGQEIPMSFEKEDEISHLIITFHKDIENKSKMQNIKKFIAFYKKNRNEEGKLATFYMRLSSQLKERVADIQSWIELEAARTKLESLLNNISKELTKFLTMVEQYNVPYDGDLSQLDVRFTKGSVLNKINDYLLTSIEEENIVRNNQNVLKVVDSYNPIKSKRKSGGNYREKLIKKIHEVFVKANIRIDDNKIKSFFFGSFPFASQSKSISFAPGEKIFTQVHQQGNLNSNYQNKNSNPQPKIVAVKAQKIQREQPHEATQIGNLNKNNVIITSNPLNGNASLYGNTVNNSSGSFPPMINVEEASQKQGVYNEQPNHLSQFDSHKNEYDEMNNRNSPSSNSIINMGALISRSPIRSKKYRIKQFDYSDFYPEDMLNTKQSIL